MKRPWAAKKAAARSAVARAGKQATGSPARTAPRTPPPPVHTRPNVLLVMTDQQRWDALGCVSDYLQTPTMDRIAAEGVRFANAYTNAPVCIPARVSMAIGRYPHNHRVWGNQRYTLAPDSDTWTGRLHEAGYRTAVFGKTHLHPHVGDLRDRIDLVRAWGLDHVDEIAGPRASTACRSNLTELWEKAGVYDAYKQDLAERYQTKPWMVRPSPLPFDLYPDVYVARQTAEWLRGYHGTDPWLCWMSFGGPHEPWDTPEPYASRYRPADMPPPIPAYSGEAPQRPTGGLDKKLEKRDFNIPPDEIAALRADYAGHVTLIDDLIGDVLKVVEDRGELDNTVIVLVSDHGEMNGDFGLIYKDNMLGPATRIPFLVRVPAGYRGATDGSVADTVIELSDVGGTILDLAGVEGKFGFSRSVVPILEDPAKEHRPVALSELWGEIMIATPTAKLTVNANGAPYLLFDLEKDPQETRNLIGLAKHADLRRDMQVRLQQRLVRTLRFGRQTLGAPDETAPA